MKSENPFKKITLQRLQQELEKYAKLKKHSLDQRPSSVQARSKKVVSKCFHGAGIVVPVHNDVGYRPIPESNASLKKIFKKVVDAKSEEEKLKHFDAVQELMTNVQFGFDEGDFGMGLEFGLNMFTFMFTFGGEAFHKAISHVLGVAYELLGRDAFIDILRAHLKNRRRGSNMSILEVVE
ncbi:histone PARylation factor 1-like [Penaeus japonicus]|uniref:histone PARylation factor 1-like n=1 Tax=Penaeus japonicus TaxID=27405 RepID=UPI001C712CFD|nr:histone PARylation factor 1-like [Penaeus japonicus]